MSLSRQFIVKLFFFGAFVFNAVMMAPINAATMRIADIPLGHVIEINGQKFIKVRNDLAKGSQFVVMSPFGTMQSWSGCASLPDPTCVTDGDCLTTTDKAKTWTRGPVLTDIRDGRRYEIRKFPDGKCWMATNLMYGGVSDACVGKNTFNGATNATATDRFGVGTYGECADPRAYTNAILQSLCPAGSTACGYYYNWQAAIQLPSAYDGSSFNPPQPVTGLCPQGWHVPRGGDGTGANDNNDVLGSYVDDDEFSYLDRMLGGTGVAHSQRAAFFWNPSYYSVVTDTDPWRAIPIDGGNSFGKDYGIYSIFWASTQGNASTAYILGLYGLSASDAGLAGGEVYFRYYQISWTRKLWGFPVRCVQD